MPPSDVEVRELVRRTLSRLLEPASKAPASPPGSPEGKSGSASRPSAPSVSRLVDEATVREVAVGATLAVPRGALVTPLARQAALDRRITLQEEGAPAAGESKTPVQQRIAIGADHGGYRVERSTQTPFANPGVRSGRLRRP